MPQRLSQFRDSSELITSNINVYLTDYGTISTTNYVANAELFRKAYNDLLSKRFSTNDNIVANIFCPPGDYYFGDNPSNSSDYSPLTLNSPQGANISIRSTVSLNWNDRPSNSALSSATTVESRYALLASFYQTRFHFGRNGPIGRASYTESSKAAAGFSNIGIFGRYGGSPGTFNKSFDIYGRGIGGSIQLFNCCVHGFGAVGATDPIQTNSINGWGLGSIGTTSQIIAVNLQVVDCMRGYISESGGSIRTFGDCCIIHNRESGIIAYQGSSVYFAGEGSGYISNYGNYGVNCYGNSVTTFGNTTSTHTVAGGGLVALRAETRGLITGQPGKTSYSTSQVLNDGLIVFV